MPPLTSSPPLLPRLYLSVLCNKIIKEDSALHCGRQRSPQTLETRIEMIILPPEYPTYELGPNRFQTTKENSRRHTKILRIKNGYQQIYTRYALSARHSGPRVSPMKKSILNWCHGVIGCCSTPGSSISGDYSVPPARRLIIMRRLVLECNLELFD